MNTKHYFALLLGVSAAAIGMAATESAASGKKLSGEVTTKFYAFDYTSGVGTDRASFLERYRVQRGWSGDNRSGIYADLDLNLNYQIADESRITVNRWGEGQYRQGGKAAWDTERVQLSAQYGFFRSAIESLDYLYSPNQVPGGTDPSYFPPGSTNTRSGFHAQFNEDSNRSLFNVSRFTYGLGFMIKPGVLGENTTVALDYNGYLRYGQRFQTYVLTSGAVIGPPSRALQRWRGFSKNIDENNNRLTLKVTASPNNLFNLAYTGVWEKFDNRARNYTIADIPSLPAPVTINPAMLTDALGFTPDATLMTHALRVSKTVGTTNLAAGYSRSDLTQDSFTVPQITFGYTDGKIATENAFFNFDSSLTPSMGVQGFLKYGNRENNSTFPVPGWIGPDEDLLVRINQIESVSYGLAAVMRPKGTGTAVTFGWKGEDKSRDHTFHNVKIIRSVSFLRADTETDEVYLKLSRRMSDRLGFRFTPSYTWADKTGLVIEPSKAVGVKAAVTYTAPDGVVWSVYYNLKDRENDNNTVTDKNVATPLSYTQDISSTIQSAGGSLNVKPAKDANAYVGLDWTQQDASVIYFESGRRRKESTTTFALRDLSDSLVDVYTLSMGGDMKLSDKATLTGNYNFTRSDGNLASGQIAAELSAIDDTLDSALHTLALGVDYALSKTRAVRVSYRYDDYQDTAYPLLSGRLHSLMFAYSVRL